MRVRMLETRRGSNDGVRVETHERGRIVEVSTDLGGVYLGEGWAVLADMPEPPAAAPVEPKAAPVAPKRNTAQKAPQKRKASGKGKA